MSSRRSTSERGTHSPSLANGDVHLDMGAGASGDGSDASSVEDEGVRHVRTIRSLQIINSWANVNNFLINSNRAVNVDAYCSYVEQLAEADPRLQLVVNDLGRERLHDQCPNCTFLDSTLVSFELGGRPSVSFRSKLHPRLQFDKHSFDTETEALGRALRTPSPRKVLICEDLQPEGAQYLGAFLSLEPRVLEYYINRDVSFESQTVEAHVFDYPETYHSGKLPRFDSEQEFLSVRDHARPCTLLRMWKDVYGLFQRVVWVVVFNKELNTYIHLILLDSLRLPKNGSATRIVSSLPSFKDWKAHRDWLLQQPPQKSFREQLQKRLLAAKVANQAEVGQDNHELEINATPEIRQAITSLLCSKWRLMIRRAQESISESSAPLAGDLDDITEVLQRKHEFEKLKRSLSALIASVKRIPGVQQSSPDIVELMSFESSLESWATQLEKVSQSLLGLLAVAESKRATEQALRSKNLQLLAFIFIPISTVSSIYGMNTVEILGRPPQNWNFVVGAVVAIAVSALAAAMYDSQITTATLHRLWETLRLDNTRRASTKIGKTSIRSRRVWSRLSSERVKPQRRRPKTQCLVM